MAVSSFRIERKRCYLSKKTRHNFPKVCGLECIVMSGITNFRSTMDHIYDNGPIILYYCKVIIVILNIVLQLPTVFSTVTCCIDL